MVSPTQITDTDHNMTAIEMICAINMHQSIYLPANEIHDKLRVTYSTTDNFSDTSLPVVLFCGPMFGSRYLSLMLNQLAKSTGVRVICIDRPGIGGSTVVPLHIRIKVWLETVPALLQRLSVKHVSLLSHSAGTIYALNTMQKLRHILDPQAPYFASMCPWVHYEHSGVSMLKIASKLPNGMLDYWNTIGELAGTRIEPSFAWSGGILASISDIWPGRAGDDKSQNDKILVRKYGISLDEAKQVERLQTKCFFAENTTGANEEARLCLKMNGKCYWESCEDYEQYIATLVHREQDHQLSQPDVARLKVRVFFAASDVMIGKQGQEYFQNCWTKFGNSAVIDYKDTELPKTNHDTVLTDLDNGALLIIFEDIAQCTSVP